MSWRLILQYSALITLLLVVLVACGTKSTPQAAAVAGTDSPAQPTLSPMARTFASPRPTAIFSLTPLPSSTPTALVPTSRPSPSATTLAALQQVAAFAVDAVDVAWSRTGDTLVVAGLSVLQLLDGRTLVEQGVFGQGPGYMAMASGPGGLLAVGVGDNTVQLWNTDTGTLMRVLEGPNRPVEGTAYNPATAQIVDVAVDTEGVLVAAAIQGYYEGGLGSVWLWDAATGEVLAILGVYGPPSGVNFCPSGAADASDELLAASTLVNSCGRGGGGIILWDTATQEMVGMLSAQGDAVTAPAFRPDGKGIVGIGPGTGQGRCLGPVVVHDWELATGEERLIAVEGTKPTAVAYQPDSGALLVGYEDGSLRLWESGAKQPWLTLAAHEAAVRGVAFSPDGSRAVSWGTDGQVVLWTSSTDAAGVVPTTVAPTPAATAATAAATAIPQATLADKGQVTAYPSLNQVNRLTFAPNDPLTLWAGTAAGVVRWDLRTDQPTLYTTADGLSGDWINDLRFAPDGTLWAATLHGVSRFDGQQWTTPSAADGMPVVPVYSLAFALDGSLWMGTQIGAVHHDGQHWTSYTTEDGLADVPVWSVGVTPNGAVWFSTHGGGVSRYDPATNSWRTFGADDGLPLPNARYLAVEPGAAGDAGVWVHIGYDHVYRYDGSRWVVAYPSGGGQWVGGITFDAHGDPWIATCDGYHTYGMGLAHGQGPQGEWSHVTIEDGLLSNSILSVAAAPTTSGEAQPILAAGTMLGISVYQNGAWRALRYGPTLSNVTTLAVAPDGAVWMGYGDYTPRLQGGGVARFDGMAWSYPANPPVNNDSVRALAIDTDGALYVGAGCNVARYQDGNWETLGVCEQVIGGVDTLAFSGGPTGLLWVGSNYGVSSYDGQAWTTRLQDVVNSLAVGPDGRMPGGVRRCH